MGVFHQLKGMLKCHFVQLRRNKCLSCVEVFCPVIILLFFFFLRLLFSVDKEEYKMPELERVSVFFGILNDLRLALDFM